MRVHLLRDLRRREALRVVHRGDAPSAVPVNACSEDIPPASILLHLGHHEEVDGDGRHDVRRDRRRHHLQLQRLVGRLACLARLAETVHPLGQRIRLVRVREGVVPRRLLPKSCACNMSRSSVMQT